MATESKEALVASSMISELANFLAQRSQTKIAREDVALAEELGREAANEAWQAEMAQLDAAKRERDIQVSREIAAQRRASVEARALARVVAAESGTSGQTIDDLQADYERIEATNTLRLAEARRRMGVTEGFQETAALSRRFQRSPDLTAPEFNTIAGILDIAGAGLTESARVDSLQQQNLKQ